VSVRPSVLNFNKNWPLIPLYYYCLQNRLD